MSEVKQLIEALTKLAVEKEKENDKRNFEVAKKTVDDVIKWKKAHPCEELNDYLDAYENEIVEKYRNKQQ